jgi:exosortase/archaeosortase family protein
MVADALRLEFIASGTRVRIAGVTLEIIMECTPVMPALLLWSAICAFPASARWKLVGVAAGGILLWVYNIARVLSLALVLRSRPAWFPFVHVYLWQGLSLVQWSPCLPPGCP